MLSVFLITGLCGTFDSDGSNDNMCRDGSAGPAITGGWTGGDEFAAACWK